MLHHVFSLMCQSVTKEKDGNISINKIITSGSVSSIPSTLPGFSIVSMWNFENDDMEPEKYTRVRYLLKAPSRTISIGGIDIDHDKATNINSVIVNLESLPIRETGSYSIKIDKYAKKRWKNVASIPFRIVEKSKPEKTHRNQNSTSEKQP
ncbi:MAG: hypothetical protein RDU30_07600 [Desulfovibrionaceae bacterium]|nr:hypothetical protein [Desulfovibrionaceae bacterium]